MRQIFTLLLLLAGFTLAAQQYNNEWIQHNQTYYKFKVGKSGLYRIPQSALVAAGLTNVQVEMLQLWRNGSEVSFYPSVPAGTLPGGGYIEFWGEANDGKPDNVLYRDPRYQHTDKLSLVSDTAVYFLTTGASPSGFKVTDEANDLSGPLPAAEPYFMYTYGNYFNNRINPGYASPLPEYVYLSSYDKGEYKSSGEINPSANFITTVNNLFVYSSGPGSALRFGASGNALNPRSIRARVNNATVKDTLMDYFNDVNAEVPLSTSLITGASFPVQFSNLSAVSNDRMVVSHFEIVYPRQFNFGNQTNFEFTLPAKNDAYYLEITNFDGGSSNPVLYDLTSNKRYTAVKSGSMLRFALPMSPVDRRLVLVNEDATNITTIPELTVKNFIDFTNIAQNANYLVITNPKFYTGTTGNNPVNEYKLYRESAVGGGFKVLVADINELTDQFAFGIKYHPLSIRNFLRYARTHFSQEPKFVFLLGRGVSYVDYYNNRTKPESDRLNMVPTFGWPGSDNLLSAADASSPVAITPIGRLSIVHSKELEDYLEKVKEYESAQRNAPATLAGREWMKNVVHVTGSSEPHLGSVLCNYMGVYRQIIQDTMFGGKVSTFCKVSTNSVEQLTSDRLVELFGEGISLLTYFGHSSSTTLEFNIDNPNAYSNQGKYPVFCVNGCNAGNFFTYSPERLVSNETLSEKFVLAKQRGSIAFLASTHLGIVNYLNLYLSNLYSVMCHKDHGKTLGETNRDALQEMFNATGGGDYYARMHAEQITLHGDPAIKINSQEKPDYVMEESLIKSSPSFISVADNSFLLKVKMVNLGRAYADSITVDIKRRFPDGSTATLYHGKVRGIMYADSLAFNVPIVASRDKGLHKMTVTVDADFSVDEMSENNNTATKEFFIYDEEARPSHPYNYSIVNDPAVKFYASTANPFSLTREYVMEIDTTENFNSPAKVSKTISSTGGMLEFNPGITYLDSTVYYWRVATVPPAGNTQYQWNNSSFTYIAGPSTGFGQEHFFQQLKSEQERIRLAEDRQWRFIPRSNNAFIRNAVYPLGSNQGSFYGVALNGHDGVGGGCGYNEIIFTVIDQNTFKPWVNNYSGPTGLYNSNKANCGSGREFNFIYPLGTAAGRKFAMDFMAMVPDGNYIIVRSNTSPDEPPTYPPNIYVNTWKDDTTALGSGNSLYHRLLNAGFADVDLYTTPRAWNFIYKKGDNTFQPRSAFSPSKYERVNLSVECPTKDSVGFITSPKFGPAAQWHEVIWRGKSLENPSKDNVIVQVIGVNNNNIETELLTLDESMQNYDASIIDPAEYPYLRLRMRNADSLAFTPYQLDFWRILYTPVPEGSLAPNITFTAKDTLEIGEIFKFAIPFKNISKPSFDSLNLKLSIIDRNNVPHVIPLPKLKPLLTGDTAMVRFDLDTKDYPEHNTVHLDVNPDFAQPEQYHFNNFLFRDFFVKPDFTNPLLDVTFDGVHIINRDIVSSKPHVQIRLKDEAKFMLLNDTSISSVQIKYPDGTSRQYHFDNDTLRFTPATSGADNSAVIDFFPAFTSQISPEGDEYELSIKAKDKSGNRAGTMEYRISFRVISKPMISNLLNYPNPFSTSTAFVFTLTGSEIPQNIKIQILTVTGKIVREITKDELGPLRIGRNITEFKWNGTDQYGSKLGNGVYLYRVVTTLNGKQMDKYKAEGDNTDKYFTNGYGKMYLMR